MKKGRHFNPERQAFIKYGPIPDLKVMLERVALINGDKEAIAEKTSNGTVVYSYNQLMSDVNAFGTKLLEMGMSTKHIAIIADNSYSWIVSYFAVSCGVGVVVPLDRELTNQDFIKLLDISDAEAIICSTSLLRSIKKILPECKRINTCVIMDAESDQPGYYGMRELIAEGKKLLEGGMCTYLEKQIDPDALSAILFTSGTTGANKGVMLSQKNICANVYDIIRKVPAEEISLSVLPMNHAFEFNCHVIPCLCASVKICINDSLKYLMSNLKEFQPGMAAVVPLFLESIDSMIQQEAKRLGHEKNFKILIAISNTLRFFGIDLRDKLFSVIRNLMGGNFSLLLCGGSAVKPDVIKRLISLGFDIWIGYGITECAPLVTANLKSYLMPSSVGTPLYDVEVKIDEPDEYGNGEILVRGENVMLGYYKDKKATDESFTGKWFRTGDFGCLDKNSALTITGRKKNTIILANGKNVQPEEIETVIQEQLPYALEVLVHDYQVKANEKHFTGIDTLLRVDFEHYFYDMQMQEIERIILTDLRQVNRTLPSSKRINTFMLTSDEFEKNTIKKVVRQKVFSRYQDKERINI